MVACTISSRLAGKKFPEKREMKRNQSRGRTKKDLITTLSTSTCTDLALPIVPLAATHERPIDLVILQWTCRFSPTSSPCRICCPEQHGQLCGLELRLLGRCTHSYGFEMLVAWHVTLPGTDAWYRCQWQGVVQTGPYTHRKRYAISTMRQ